MSLLKGRQKELKALLDAKYREVNVPRFVLDDPISIPRSYSKLQDIEITAFWTAILSWGQRKTIINKCHQLFEMMDGSPYDFIVNHRETDRKIFSEFKHRTFQYTDTLYFLEFLQYYYNEHDSLEDFFVRYKSVEDALSAFHNYFFSLESAPVRTRKHIASPERKSTCKRLNMFLRWMVRPDESGVDFGLWKRMDTALLMLPLDVHVERVARRLGILKRKQRDWQAVCELTEKMRLFDPYDPVKYDFALYGMGIMGDL
ncbi:MAG: TIGR02757 family protein [Saprospiraceae bacterium]|jgi:uncharacterized protein (TIGR02757 family)